VEDNSMKLVQSALRGLSLRQQAISNNLANIDTPGYRGTDVSFEGELKRAIGSEGTMALARTSQGHLVAARSAGTHEMTPQVVDLPGAQLRNDGNTVDVDREMSRLAETALTYNALVEAMNLKLSLLRSVITEGRR
jgi:flagellar basal-body rod protein FlgB